MWTTHGGRMSSPIVDGDQVIVSGLTFLWGHSPAARTGSCRFDKSTGQTVWVSSLKAGRLTPSTPTRSCRRQRHADVLLRRQRRRHARVKVDTGEPVWNWLVSKRGLNTAALVVGEDVIVSHSEENIGSNEMGMMAAVPAASEGVLTGQGARWLVRGVQAGYASPVTDGERSTSSTTAGAVRVRSQERQAVWQESIGTIAKASPVSRTASSISAPRTPATPAEVLHHPAARRPSRDPRSGLARHAAEVEQIIASPIVARGRLRDLDGRAHASGRRPRPTARRPSRAGAAEPPRGAGGLATVLMVQPTELIRTG